MNGKCALCLKDATLLESHIIPKFVVNWLKDTGGAIRNSHTPNLRVQDGIKEYLLCVNCEELFSGWEKKFCEQVFFPIHKDEKIASIKYRKWALKFAVSVSWRTLLHYQRLHNLSHFSTEQKTLVYEALDIWRSFLLDEIENPKYFEQHLVLFDAIETYSGKEISPFLNRYLLRSMHMDVICTNKTAMVYTKMARFALFGIIQGSTKKWRGTKLHVNQGSIIRKTTYCLPDTIMQYINDKANEAAKALASVSDVQKEKIQKAIHDNADKIIETDSFRAIQADVYHSGKDAFKITGSLRKDSSE